MKMSIQWLGFGTIWLVLAQACASPSPDRDGPGDTSRAGSGTAGGSSAAIGDQIRGGSVAIAGNGGGSVAVTSIGGSSGMAGFDEAGRSGNVVTGQAGISGSGGVTDLDPGFGSAGATTIERVYGGLTFHCEALPPGDLSGCSFPVDACPNYSSVTVTDPTTAALRFPEFCSVVLGPRHPFYPNAELMAFCYKSAAEYLWACPL